MAGFFLYTEFNLIILLGAPMSCSDDFWRKRLETIGAIIIQYEDAILQLSTGAVQSYSLNTGQTTQSVTKFDVARLQSALPGLYDQYATLDARVNGCGVVKVDPAW